MSVRILNCDVMDGLEQLADESVDCVVTDHRSCHGEAVHPTQKPVAVMAPLIEYSCPPGGTVLDPFIGSGTTAQAAAQLGMSCIGIEINPDYAAMARNPVAPDAPLFSKAPA